MKRIILGSQSPRRKELMQLADLPCEVMVADINETIPADIQAADAPLFLAQKKADAIFEKIDAVQQPECVVITSDTIVVCENTVLGKPKDSKGAKAMLELLSGKTHEVLTGVVIKGGVRSYTHTAVVSVTFKSLDDAEIDYYIQQYQPFDKAGAYAIQEWIGAIGITAIKGDYYSVMGLPVQWVYTILKEQFDI